ncbi:MAG: SOS response-associated peptidase [Gaiellales bacterium]
MCGRFTSTAERAEIAERFAAALPESVTARFNIAPAQGVLTVRQADQDDERVAQLMRWGLIPRWARDASVSYKMINARAETVAEKPVYQQLLARHRCLIPADGFYEWRREPDGRKLPVRFTLADESLFAFAGLWTSWVDRSTGELLDSCTIITTKPNELVAPVHNRMPVILPRSNEDDWLDPSLAPGDVLRLLGPYAAQAMRARAVSPAVNDARNEGADLLVPGAA